MLTPKERMKKYREKRQKDGWRQVNVWLTPDARLCVDEIMARYEAKGITKSVSEIVCDALLLKS